VDNSSRDIYLVSCVASKGEHVCEAKELYTSPLFKKMRQYAEKYAENWYILSTKYHLLRPEEVIEPYELTLKQMSAEEIRTWAQETLEMLKKELYPTDVVTIFAGKQYRRYLLKSIQEMCHEVRVPMENLGIGQQLQWLKENLSNSETISSSFIEERTEGMEAANIPFAANESE
jgi:hypothetical protein